MNSSCSNIPVTYSLAKGGLLFSISKKFAASSASTERLGHILKIPKEVSKLAGIQEPPIKAVSQNAQKKIKMNYQGERE